MSTHPPHPAIGGAPLRAALQAAHRQQRFCTLAARLLADADLHVIAHAFRFTARQEQEHIAVLRAMLGTDAPCDPEDIAGDAQALLTEAIRREEASHALLLPRAAREAADPRRAAALWHIAANDDAHAQRFRRFLCALQDGTLLHSPAAVSWICLTCGALHHGCDAPAACEGCSGSRSHFIRSDFSPFDRPWPAGEICQQNPCLPPQGVL